MIEDNEVMWMLVITVSLGIGVLIAIRDHYSNQPGRCSSKVELTGKTAIITGASSGVGMETARALAERGCRIYLATEKMRKAKQVADDIIKTTSNSEVFVRYLDTSELSSVRKFAQDFLKAENSLQFLVNCANFKGQQDEIYTVDGLEKTLATNHFGHFLLTNLVLGLLKKSAPSRIITLSSESHRFCKEIDSEDLNYDKSLFKGFFEAYGLSKLCTNLFTLELAKRLQGTGVTANCVQPRASGGEIYSKGRRFNVHSVAASLCQAICKPEKLESQVVDYMVVSEEVENITGCYFVNFKISEPSNLSRDKDLAERVWKASETLVRLSPEETQLW